MPIKWLRHWLPNLQDVIIDLKPTYTVTQWVGSEWVANEETNVCRLWSEHDPNNNILLRRNNHYLLTGSSRQRRWLGWELSIVSSSSPAEAEEAQEYHSVHRSAASQHPTYFAYPVQVCDNRVLNDFEKQPSTATSVNERKADEHVVWFGLVPSN